MRFSVPTKSHSQLPLDSAKDWENLNRNALAAVILVKSPDASEGPGPAMS